LILINEEEFSWAQDVLAQYFEIHAKEESTFKFRQKFEEKVQLDKNSGGRVPYLRNLENECPVSYDELFALSRRRRSVRWFSEKPVARQLLEKALLIALQSPSACNRQPFRFHFFDDKELVQRISRVPMGTGGYAEQIPVLGVVIGQQRNYFNERDRHVIYIDSSLATMSFVYALETLGLSSCCINWPDVESKERQIESLIRLEADERVVMLLAIGYPDEKGMVAYSAKKAPEEVSVFNL
jgi:nitroreductase